MDLKDLNKPQLIMLALLLSFVTSIATGITTVTLMQQAPESVTVPINRVVRETVEKIVQVPVPGKNTTQTIVIKEEDLVVDAIAKNQLSVFSITKETTDAEEKSVETNVGRGFIVSKEGVVVVDGSLVSPDGVYYAKNADSKFKTDFLPVNQSSPPGFYFLKIGEPVDDKSKTGFSVPIFGDLNKMKTGQKVLILGSGITSFIFEDSEMLKKNVLTGIFNKDAGAMVINLDAEVLGIVLSGDTASFVSIDTILETLKSI